MNASETNEMAPSSEAPASVSAGEMRAATEPKAGERRSEMSWIVPVRIAVRIRAGRQVGVSGDESQRLERVKNWTFEDKLQVYGREWGDAPR